MPIQFCHIAPTKYLPLVKDHDTHLLLAHLVEEDQSYREFYTNLKKQNPSVFYHLDNSAFEMFKRGEPMYPSEKLIKMGKLVKADSIVLSDYPKDPWKKTVDSAINLIPKFKDAGFMTFFCPQSELGDLEGLMQSFEWAIDNDDVNFIGVSILACPISLGVNETKFVGGMRDEGYRLQRYLARWTIFQELWKRDMLGANTFKRFHCLGMTDGPKEIELLQDYSDYIFSWDSSAAIWHGIQGIQFDNSPTGLRNGKCEVEVNFDIELTKDVAITDKIKYNMYFIDNICEVG